MAGLSRRRFVREAVASVTAFVAVGCTSHHPKSRVRRTATTTTLGFRGNFGERIDAGPLENVRASIAGTQAPLYVPEARAYVSAFPAELADDARKTYPAEVHAVLDAGVVVLYQRCTHLGCRVPWCATSRYFECPCHDAKFDAIGEKRQGPAPRGMDLIKSSIENGRLVIDTGTILDGLPVGTNTSHQAPAGPFCV